MHLFVEHDICIYMNLSNAKKGGIMRSVIDIRVILGLGLLALGGARVLPAAEVNGDGQEQARLLLSGSGASPFRPKSTINPLTRIRCNGSGLTVIACPAGPLCRTIAAG